MLVFMCEHKKYAGSRQRLRVTGATPHWQAGTGDPAPGGATLASEHPVWLSRFRIGGWIWSRRARADSFGLTFIYTTCSYIAYVSPHRHYPLVFFLLLSLFLIWYKQFY